MIATSHSYLRIVDRQSSLGLPTGDEYIQTEDGTWWRTYLGGCPGGPVTGVQKATVHSDRLKLHHTPSPPAVKPSPKPNRSERRAAASKHKHNGRRRW